MTQQSGRPWSAGMHSGQRAMQRPLCPASTLAAAAAEGGARCLRMRCSCVSIHWCVSISLLLRWHMMECTRELEFHIHCSRSHDSYVLERVAFVQPDTAISWTQSQLGPSHCTLCRFRLQTPVNPLAHSPGCKGACLTQNEGVPGRGECASRGRVRWW